MPSPLAPRRTSHRKVQTLPRRFGLNTGRPAVPGIDTSSVMDRVRQWQAQGGGVVTAPEIFEGSSDDNSPPTAEDGSEGSPDRDDDTVAPLRPRKRKSQQREEKDVPTTPKKSTETAEPNTRDSHHQESRRDRTGTKRDAAAASAAAAAARLHARSVSAPRRRIVSDEHWRSSQAPKRASPAPRDKSPFEDSSRTNNRTGPSWTLPDDGIRVRPMDETTTETGTNQNHGISNTVPRRQRRRNANDDGIRVYSTEEKATHETHDAQIKEEERIPTPTIMDKLSDKSLNFQSPTPSMRESAHSEETEDEAAFSFEETDDVDARKPQNSRKVSKLTRQAARDRHEPIRHTLRDRGRKNSRAGILGHVIGESKKIFGKADPPPVAAPQGPSIESWLNGTPDPFVDGGFVNHANDAASVPPEAMNDDALPVVDESHVSSSHRRLSQRDVNLSRMDSNKIWDALDNTERTTPEAATTRRRRRREVAQQDSAPVRNLDEVHDSPKSKKATQPETPTKPLVDVDTSSSLRRRGARRKSTVIPAEWRKDQSPVSTNVEPLAHTSARSCSSAEIVEPILPLRPRKDSPNSLHQSPTWRPLSTIPSVDTLGSKARLAVDRLPPPALPEPPVKDNEPLQYTGEARDQFDLNGLDRRTSKSRVTRHADLISVLSMPRGEGGRSIRSARSVRSVRAKADAATLPELMKELATDEEHYLRELRTLVDGVIPVLLTSILSKASSEATICLFSSRRRARDDPLVSQPIYDMGIALERLKRVHKRIPTEHADAFIIWARGAEGIYRDYLKAWRMGFQDVIVNLAPADGGPGPIPGTGSTVDGGLPRNENGDVLGQGGERVDVAFLLKRPLVRLKFLTKTLRSISQIKANTEAEPMSEKYQALVVEARDRVNQERARLEDEAAADIDPTKARDPCTLAPIDGIVIEESRHVRARDCFNLTLVHSSGQTIDCRIELILRENTDGKGFGGDLLVCEVDGTGRWLLFPPVLTTCVSARNGDKQGEIVVMLRGGIDSASGQHFWHEIMILQAEEEEVGFEWVQMLGLVPVPPHITRSQSFLERQRSHKSYNRAATDSGYASSQTEISTEQAPTPREIEVPLGESKRNRKLANVGQSHPLVPDVPRHLQARLERRGFHSRSESAKLESIQVLNYSSEQGQGRSLDSLHTRRRERRKTLSGISEEQGIPAAQPPKATTERFSHRRQMSTPPEDLFERPQANEIRQLTPNTLAESEPPNLPESMPRTLKKLTKKWSGTGELPPPTPEHRSVSPSHVLEANPPVLTSSHASSARSRTSSPLKRQYEPSTSSDTDGESESSSIAQGVSSMSDDETDEEADFGEEGDVAMPLLPPGALLNKLKKSTTYGGATSRGTATLTPSESASQAPYKHVPPQPGKQVKVIATIYHWSDKGSWEVLHPDECSINVTPGLIEAYEMSSLHSIAGCGDNATQTSINSASSSRASSANTNALRPLVGLELTPLVPIRRGTALDISIRSPPTADSTISSSNVLKGSTAGNFMFRSRSAEECDALYALINHARCNNPTYIALQHARATSYAKPFGGASFNAGTGGAAGTGAGASKPGSSSSGRGSWFGFGQRSGYRAAANAALPQASTEPSATGSVGSMFSALKKFGLRGSSRFSIARSTVTSRQGGRPGGAGSVFSSSDHSSSSGTSTPQPPEPTNAESAFGAPVGDAVGLTNAKIRLYVRESASKWRDLGQARMTIMRPGECGPSGVQSPGGASTPPPAPPFIATTIEGPGVLRPSAADKRIVVVGAKKGDTLLDATLGESCFERVARTGLAVSVYEGAEDGRVAKEGGVVAGRFRVYMVQMKSEAETAYTFGIVGRNRY